MRHNRAVLQSLREEAVEGDDNELSGYAGWNTVLPSGLREAPNPHPVQVLRSPR